ncbi:MAG: hypothetical protein ABI460_15975 [Caldimonas sp.]
MPPSSANRDPPPEPAPGITLVLNRALAGDSDSRERVYALLYVELLRLARSPLSGLEAISLNPVIRATPGPRDALRATCRPSRRSRPGQRPHCGG